MQLGKTMKHFNRS